MYQKELEQYNVRAAWPQPRKCALLVIDMQEYFRPMAGSIVGNVVTLIDVCREAGIKIICTRHGHMDPQRDGGMLLDWWGECILYGSDAWQLMKAVNPEGKDFVVDKNRCSAFAGTPLDEILHSRMIEEVIITGVMTNCCCETTAREAFMRDYRVFFVSDATATVNDDLHLASLKNLAFGFAHIVDTKSLCDRLLNSLPK